MTPKQIFDLLVQQVVDLRSLGAQLGPTGPAGPAHRAAVVLTVAALDTYMHERGRTALFARASASPDGATKVAGYLKGLDPSDIMGDRAEVLIRYRLSFKTLQSPTAIDECMQVAGADPAEVWRLVGIDTGEREQRLRNALDLAVDRRNQIAHEGDWDFVQVAQRHVSESHVDDTLRCITRLVDGLEAHW